MISFELNTEINKSPINDIVDYHIFNRQKLLADEKFIIDNSYIIPFREEYNYRPDLVAFEEYGDYKYYPILLYVNKIGSLFKFNKINLNSEIIVPNIDFVNKYLLN